MKKVILFGAAAVFALSLAACKKDYTCVCKDSDGEELGRVTYKTTKSKAKDACNTSASTYGTTITCAIQ